MFYNKDKEVTLTQSSDQTATSMVTYCKYTNVKKAIRSIESINYLNLDGTTPGHVISRASAHETDTGGLSRFRVATYQSP